MYYSHIAGSFYGYFLRYMEKMPQQCQLSDKSFVDSIRAFSIDNLEAVYTYMKQEEELCRYRAEKDEADRIKVASDHFRQIFLPATRLQKTG